ncbi:complement regulator-acquiring protein (plasmid) [Borreliella californiensis]|uniref:Complement regulator-acquiring protein n=1 Tax=Borreliella californiensis TaxID=373543 RepID=A0A7X0DQI0_9SPIR|nr:complement regulator-acquiring protein [Borreliella californiensis]MBB6213417.1 hypothetical protein [Borreliella californiensis]MBB6213424.1 hypothetical protein [Borreliella californiensis]WKC91322.1 complement regulator-acquiring protein [Borreliella californiensis]WNY70982.1 complement regulator-acquiring protein [Borreliella californiensis]
MTKAKLNITKLNIITMILTLICISCAPFNKIDPKATENTKLKKTAKLNKVANLKNTTNPGENIQNFFKDESEDFSPSDQKFMETIDSKLKEMGKKLKDQNNKESTQIDTMTKEESSLLDPYIGANSALANEDEKILLKRILYSSLDYKKENIETLKEILEILICNIKIDSKIAANFLYRTALGIQQQLESHLKLINEKLDTQSKEDSKEDLKALLVQTESSLQLKERFKKNLNETIEAYNKNTSNIQNDVKILAEHFHQYYKDFNALKAIS